MAHTAASSRRLGVLKARCNPRGYISCRLVRANIGGTWNFGYILRDSSGERAETFREAISIFTMLILASAGAPTPEKQGREPACSPPRRHRRRLFLLLRHLLRIFFFLFFFEKVASNPEQQSQLLFFSRSREMDVPPAQSPFLLHLRFLLSFFFFIVFRRRRRRFLFFFLFFLSATRWVHGGCALNVNDDCRVCVYPSGCVWAALVGAKILTFDFVEVSPHVRSHGPSRNSER